MIDLMRFQKTLFWTFSVLFILASSYISYLIGHDWIFIIGLLTYVIFFSIFVILKGEMLMATKKKNVVLKKNDKKSVPMKLSKSGMDEVTKKKTVIKKEDENISIFDNDIVGIDPDKVDQGEEIGNYSPEEAEEYAEDSEKDQIEDPNEESKVVSGEEYSEGMPEEETFKPKQIPKKKQIDLEEDDAVKVIITRLSLEVEVLESILAQKKKTLSKLGY